MSPTLVSRQTLPNSCTQKARLSSGERRLGSMCVEALFARGQDIDCASQDIRDLVLHLSADAPPPSWVRVEVCRRVVPIFVRSRCPPLQEPAFSAEGRGAPGSGNYSRINLFTAPSYICHRKSELSSGNFIAARLTSRRVVARRSLHWADIQPCMSNPCTRRSNAHALCAELILSRPYHRRGEKEANN